MHPPARLIYGITIHRPVCCSLVRQSVSSLDKEDFARAELHCLYLLQLTNPTTDSTCVMRTAPRAVCSLLWLAAILVSCTLLVYFRQLTNQPTNFIVLKIRWSCASRPRRHNNNIFLWRRVAVNKRIYVGWQPKKIPPPKC